MDKKDGQVGAGVVEQSPDHFRSLKLMFIRLKPSFEIKQYLHVKKESLTPGLKRPLSLPDEIRFADVLRLRLFHWAGRARQEEDINIHIPQPGFMDKLLPAWGGETFSLPQLRGEADG